MTSLTDETKEQKRIENFALPNTRMIYKMMRACISVTDKDKIWVSQVDHVEEDRLAAEKLQKQIQGEKLKKKKEKAAAKKAELEIKTSTGKTTAKNSS